jgi:patatin-like phospholipase/acyl hydrolase
VRLSTSDPVAVRRLSEDFRRAQESRGRATVMLSLSGGGANGAYGAGVLYGWSERGDRPVFDVVTGISTGALAAPFAFLGRQYDETLRFAYTGGRSTGLLSFEGIFALFRNSFYSAKPLERLVDGFIDDGVIRAVAAESAKGRRLLVATANLDTQDLVLWDMGAIARTGGPAAARLFRKILIASASIPGIFPPVMIDVAAGAARFSEMHVDGSTITSFFAVPEAMLLSAEPLAGTPKAKLYVLLNGKFENEFAVTPRSTLPILERSYDTASKANTRIAVAAIAAFGRANGLDLALSYIPPGVAAAPLNFDQKHMQALFELGRRQTADGMAWRDPLVPAAQPGA